MEHRLAVAVTGAALDALLAVQRVGGVDGAGGPDGAGLDVWNHQNNYMRNTANKVGSVRF